VLFQTGAWAKAETELEAAVAVFAGGRRAALADGTARLGELRRRQGRLDEARSLFTQAERSWTARIGSIELALDQDDAATALALAERLERATAGGRQLDRVAVLGLLVRAAIATGDVAAASKASAELDGLAAAVATTGARAVASYAGGEAALARGDLDVARRRLEDAVDLFAPDAAPYEQARARLALARALLRLGAPDTARAEAAAAQEAFSRLDARLDVAAAARLLSPAAGPPSLLTAREREVLAFVAEGRSNREIASELVVSQHTVHRHVANILRKLDEPTRAAAAARAARDGLV
jgi:LuxR family transcriptional regulator, maltose regulon positive regulatory protein